MAWFEWLAEWIGFEHSYCTPYITCFVISINYDVSVNIMDQYLDVIMDDLDSHPHCPHGPTLLFKRIYRTKERRFYACAACRDRKQCRFFHWADDTYTESKRKLWELERQKSMLEQDHSELYVRLCKVRDQVPGKRADYCHTCSKLVLPNETEEHVHHDIAVGITLQQITHPSELLKPLETNTKEAQYLFSKNAIKTIIKAAENIDVKSMICIGAPRLHEYIRADHHGDMRSLLLDIDKRYHSFYTPEEFCWFNAFNNYFFHEDTSKLVLTEYLQQNKGEGMMIVMDPPFGGRIEPLAYTLRQIQKLHRELNPHLQEDMRVMLISPYFMEPHILANCPDYQMLDYKVAYDNHPLFSQGPKARKLGSPVRIFTNISPQRVLLPPEEGYWLCEPCERWVSPENRHCKDCGTCTSKSGCTYVHCFKCGHCVKPTWEHCDTCQRCCLVPHKCGVFVPSRVCYKCGQAGHKKYNCPEIDGDIEITASNKRRRKQINRKTRKRKRDTSD